MAKPGPQKINRYGVDFKLRAVQMSHQPGVLVKDVAESLCQVRNGELKYVPKADLLLRRAAAASRNVRPRNPSL
jgi:transposase-like protein